MKKLCLMLLAAISIAACSKTERPSVPGAYNMLKQNFKGDTTDQNFTNPQMKIYTQEYMMFASYVPEDSASSFGIAKYVLTDEGVDETQVYYASDTSESLEATVYHLAIEKTDNGFKQIIRDMDVDGQKYVLTEEYEKRSNTANSPLDGTWTMTGSLWVTPKGDTTKLTQTSYKTYSAGNFMFGQTFVDSLKVMHTGLGYGTFTMNGDNSVNETLQTCSWPPMNGKTFSLQLTFNGPDEFTQVLKDENGTSVEMYKRLGK